MFMGPVLFKYAFRVHTPNMNPRMSIIILMRAHYRGHGRGRGRGRGHKRSRRRRMDADVANEITASAIKSALEERSERRRELVSSLVPWHPSAVADLIADYAGLATITSIKVLTPRSVAGCIIDDRGDLGADCNTQLKHSADLLQFIYDKQQASISVRFKNPEIYVLFSCEEFWRMVLWDDTIIETGFRNRLCVIYGYFSSPEAAEYLFQVYLASCRSWLCVIRENILGYAPQLP